MVMGVARGWSYEQTHLEVVLEAVAVFAIEGLGPVCICVLALCPVAIRRQLCAAGESKLVVTCSWNGFTCLFTANSTCPSRGAAIHAHSQ